MAMLLGPSQAAAGAVITAPAAALRDREKECSRFAVAVSVADWSNKGAHVTPTLAATRISAEMAKSLVPLPAPESLASLVIAALLEGRAVLAPFR